MSSPTTPEDLALRLLACPLWRWQPGAVDTHGVRVITKPGADGWMTVAVGDKVVLWITDEMDPPDLNDPATVGCLRWLVQEAAGDLDVWRFMAHALARMLIRRTITEEPPNGR